MLEVAWASSSEGSNGWPGGEGARRSVVMESERTDSMGARNNHQEKGIETETDGQGQRNRQGQRERDK